MEIEAIFLDLGNTLRFVQKDEAYQADARRRIAELVGSDEDPETFCAKVDERYKEYRKWAFENMREAPESELWTRWLAPEFPAERIAPLGEELTYQYRRANGIRVLVENGLQVVDTLFCRGYTLGIISNLISTREIPEWLNHDGLAHYFKSVALSSVLGIRKPDPEIYLTAARRAGVAPEHCAYVGDNLKRDVTGTRVAGFGMSIIMLEEQKLADAEINEDNRPDAIILRFDDLLELFPGCPQVTSEKLFAQE
jgi:HAD superfamily hydrolase (TIGR01549 family)